MQGVVVPVRREIPSLVDRARVDLAMHKRTTSLMQLAASNAHFHDGVQVERCQAQAHAAQRRRARDTSQNYSYKPEADSLAGYCAVWSASISGFSMPAY